MPSTIEQVWRERKGQRFVVLAVNFEEGRKTVAAWVRAKGVTMPILLDTDGKVTATYRVTGTPTVVLVGPEGGMVARGVGMRPWDRGAGRALLDALIPPPAR